MTKQEIDKMILNMYNDSTYQELKAYYDKTTVFNVLGKERSETAHSSFLCWLLDANASHGMGDEPIKKLKALSKQSNQSKYSKLLETFSSHPDFDERIERMRTKAEKDHYN